MESSTVYHGLGVRVTRLDDQRIEITVAWKWSALVIAVIFPPIAIILGLLLAGLCYELFTRKFPGFDADGMLVLGIVVAIIGLVGLLVVLMILAAAQGLLSIIYPRKIILDFAQRPSTFRCGPGLGYSFSAEGIESVVLCSYSDRGWRIAHLCFAIRGKSRLLRIQSIARSSGSEADVRAELLPLAECLAALLDRPIEDKGRVTAWRLSWL
jgi:hypothetical protein